MSVQFQFKGKLLKVVTKTRLLPNGRRTRLEIIEHPGAVLIVPFLSSNQVILIHQFRPVLNTYLYELPAGTLNPNERPRNCAARELTEETGYSAEKLIQLGKIFPVPGYSTEVITIFKAKKLRPKMGQKDADEIIKICPMSRTQIQNLFRRGRIQDAKTISALVFCGIL